MQNYHTNGNPHTKKNERTTDYPDKDNRVRIDIPNLPIMEIEDQLVAFIQANPVSVISIGAPTGSGKTIGTMYLLRKYFGPKVGIVLMEAQREVTKGLRRTLEDVLDIPIGMKLGGDKGINWRGESTLIATTGSAFGVVRKMRPLFVVLDEYDFDSQGEVTLMSNMLWHGLDYARKQGRPFVVILPSATPDVERARRFYNDFPYLELNVQSRLIEPKVLRVDIGSERANSFRDVIENYTRIIRVVCSESGYEQNGEIYKIPLGESLFCTLPSPLYFNEIADAFSGSSRVEVVRVWSKASPQDKARLRGERDPQKTVLFLATDFIRRGDTPNIFGVAPSGFQNRRNTDKTTGFEGIHEERTSEPEYTQDRGRCARYKEGLVIEVVDGKRPKSMITPFERQPLEIHLLDILHYENINDFRWWPDITKDQVMVGLQKLYDAEATIVGTDGVPSLTQLGETMRTVSGSLEVRKTAVKARELNVLVPYVIAANGINLDLMVNPGDKKDKDEIVAKQKAVANPRSDWATILNIWKEICRFIDWTAVGGAVKYKIERRLAGLRDTFQEKKREIERRHHDVPKSQRIEMIEVLRVQFSEREKEINDDIPAMRLNEAMRRLEKESGTLSFKFGLYPRAIMGFVRAVLESIETLGEINEVAENGNNGAQNDDNATSTKQVESFEIFDILKMTDDVKPEVIDRLHAALLWGLKRHVYVNVPHRGYHGYFYRLAINESADSLGVFPGSATFHDQDDFLLGVVTTRKKNNESKTYLTNVVKMSKVELVRLQQLANIPSDCVTDSVQYDVHRDAVVGNVRRMFCGQELSTETDVSLTGQTATKFLADTLATKHVSYPWRDVNLQVVLKFNAFHARSQGRIGLITVEKLAGHFLGKLTANNKTPASMKEAVEAGVNLELTMDDAGKILSINDLVGLIAEVEKTRPVTHAIKGTVCQIEYLVKDDFVGALLRVPTSLALTMTVADLPNLGTCPLRILVAEEGYADIEITPEGLPSLASAVEARRIKLAWDRARKVHGEENPTSERDDEWFMGAINELGRFEVTKTQNGTGEPIFGYAGMSDNGDTSMHCRYGYKIFETEEQANASSKRALRQALRYKILANTLVITERTVPDNETRQNLQEGLSNLLNAKLEALQRFNGESVNALITEMRITASAKFAEANARLVEVRNAWVAAKEAVDSKLAALGDDAELVATEEKTARATLENAFSALKTLEYDKALQLATEVQKIVAQFEEKAQQRTKPRAAARQALSEVEPTLEDVYYCRNGFEDAEDEEGRQANTLLTEIREFMKNMDFANAISRIDSARACIQKVKARLGSPEASLAELQLKYQKQKSTKRGSRG